MSWWIIATFEEVLATGTENDDQEVSSVVYHLFGNEGSR